MTVIQGDVAIIGAGIAGIALALTLNKQSISCRIYESKGSDAAPLASGVVLTPNGLRVLDSIAVFERIRSKCWQSEFRTYKNDKDETTKKVLITNEDLYGFKNHRLYRQFLLDEMKKMLAESNVQIIYNAKFNKIVNDGPEGVDFEINDKIEHASTLIGADGIHSNVRKYLNPGIDAEYTGVLGVLGHINRSTVQWPYSEFEKACTLQGKPGAIFMMPEVADGSEIMVGTQVQYPDRSKEAWVELSADKDRLCEFFRDGYDQWHNTAKSIIDSLCTHKETLFIWPMMKMPNLDRWFSATGRVLIVGDAAHALPPSSAQGANQALEDVYVLSALFKSSKSWLDGLDFWQKMRQARVDDIFDYTMNSTNVARMSEEERNKLIREGKVKDPAKSETDMGWLYKPDLDGRIEAWLKPNNQSRATLPK